MTDSIDNGRRRFLGTVAATLTVGRLVGSSVMEAQPRLPGELAAIARATEWINSPRLASSGLAGRVVLVNFWTYTCINWIRTLPYIRAWADRYKQRLVLIGVHTPEFPFEHALDNVRRAVRQARVEHPVVIDNDYAIWRAFGNQYWPALYFIDARGRVRERHFGEGQYEQAEKVIQRLLAEGNSGGSDAGVVSVNAAGVEVAADWANLRSPENYLGYDRTEGFASPRGAERDRRHLYAAPARLALNQWALAGEWTMGRQAAAGSSANGRIVSRFHARDLHLVMGPARPGTSIRFRVTLDGQPPRSAGGGDVDASGNGTVVEQRLYQLIRQPQPIVDRQFEIEFLDAGVEAFAFTFG